LFRLCLEPRGTPEKSRKIKRKVRRIQAKTGAFALFSPIFRLLPCFFAFCRVLSLSADACRIYLFGLINPPNFSDNFGRIIQSGLVSLTPNEILADVLETLKSQVSCGGILRVAEKLI
jgi:hypothetical protein